MTEDDWRTALKPYPMLEYLETRESVEGRLFDRKLELFSVACLRRIWGLITDELCRKVVDEMERCVGKPPTNDARRVFDTFLAAYETDQLRDAAGGSTNEAIRFLFYGGARAAMIVARATSEAVGFVAANSLQVTSSVNRERA